MLGTFSFTSLFPLKHLFQKFPRTEDQSFQTNLAVLAKLLQRFADHVFRFFGCSQLNLPRSRILCLLLVGRAASCRLRWLCFHFAPTICWTVGGSIPAHRPLSDLPSKHVPCRILARGTGGGGEFSRPA